MRMTIFLLNSTGPGLAPKHTAIFPEPSRTARRSASAPLSLEDTASGFLPASWTLFTPAESVSGKHMGAVTAARFDL